MDFIKRVRLQHGLSQETMAKRLGISRPTYAQIENGDKELTLSQAAIINELAREYQQSRQPNQPPAQRSSSKFNPRKFKETLLYILEKVGAKPNIGETALYKLLYFIDFDAFEKWGQPITGATYMKNHHGPTPKQFKPLTDEMIEAGELERVKSRYFQYDQKKYLPRRPADLAHFTALEKTHIDDILARLANKNGSELRAYSHEDVPWLATDDQKDIDYQLVSQRESPYAQFDYEEMMQQASANDILKYLPPLTKEEYDYYMSLPDKS